MAAAFIWCPLFTKGMVTNYCIMACGLLLLGYVALHFRVGSCWIGKYTNQASAFLIMMILGAPLFRRLGEP